MRDKENQEVLDYLNAEADYTAAVTAAQQPLRERIFEEIKSRTLLTDLTVPNRIGGLVVLQPHGSRRSVPDFLPLPCPA